MTDTPAKNGNSNGDRDLTGLALGDYQMLRRLGRGAMASVYLAEQVSLKRKVAIKTLRDSLADNEKYVQRFHHEAQAVASLSHANIVQIFEVGCIDDIHFIAQEYVPGQNVRQLIGKNGPLELRLSVTILRQAAAALFAAGKKGVVHRDVKPDNIMITGTGEVKVADFGLARVMRQTESLHLTDAGVTMGTPLYMSPEQVEGKDLDPRSDIYSLGITAYHMLAGEPPFGGDSALNVAVQHLKKEPERLENRRPDLPEALCRIIHRMLAKNPDDRQQDAAVLLRELRDLKVEGLGDDGLPEVDDWATTELATLASARIDATMELDELMKTAAVNFKAQQAKRRWVWIASALAMAALVIGVVVAWSTREPYLLAGASTEVPRLPSANSQYTYSMDMRTEDAYRAVWENFPDESDKYYALRAKQQLARLYIEQLRFDEALEVLQELADLDPRDRQFRPFGLAMQGIVLEMNGDHATAKKKLDAAQPLRDALDPDTRRELEIFRQRNQRSLAESR